MQPVGQESVNTKVHFDVFFMKLLYVFYLSGFRILRYTFCLQRQMSGRCQAVLRQSSGNGQEIVKQSSSSCQANVRQSGGSHQDSRQTVV